LIASGNDGHLVGRKGIGLTTILAQCSGRCSCREQGGISTEETGTASSQTGQMLDDLHLQLTSIWLEWSKHLQMLRVLADLPLNLHPAGTGALWVDTPIGAGGATDRCAELSCGAARLSVAVE
jgi:hypothetical protein